MARTLADKVDRLARGMNKPAILRRVEKAADKRVAVALYGVGGPYEVRVSIGDHVAWSCEVPNVRVGNAIVRALRALIAEHGTWA